MRQSTGRVAGAAALSFGLAAALFSAPLAQNPPNPPSTQPPPAPQSQRPPVFRGGANFVLVDAYPQEDGRIVEGLSAADFQVLEDGKPQKVETFEFVRIEPSLSEAERRDPNTRPESYALAADPHNRVFVVFLDAPHVTVDGSRAIRRPLVDALNRIVAPNDLFGVTTPNIQPRHIVLGRRLLTVEEQLTRHWPWGERHRLGFDPNDPGEEFLFGCFSCKPTPIGCVDWYVDEGAVRRRMHDVLIDRRREDRTLTALEGLIMHLASLREARTVVLAVTDGWLLYRENRALAEEAAVFRGVIPEMQMRPGGRLGVGNRIDNYISPAACTTELLRLAHLDNDRHMRDVIALANRSNVSVYPITPGGIALFDTPISERVIPNPRAPAGEFPLTQSMGRATERVHTLRTIAENTDGLAIVNTNDLAAGLKRIVDDVSAYYLLGYYSTNTKFDGNLRRIQVKVSKPGVRVRARRGYLAPDLRERAGDKPVVAEAPPTAVTETLGVLSRLRAGAEVFVHGTADEAGVHVAVEIASAQLIAGRWPDGADVQVAVTAPDGAKLGTAAGRIEPRTRGTLVHIPLAMTPAGPLRATVRVGAGADSREERVEVTPSAGRVLGDPMLYRGTPAATSPLRAVADFQYRRTERAHVEWPIVAAAIDRREARLLGRNGQPLAVPVTVTERERDGRRMLAADVNLAPLTDGDYVIEVTAAGGGQTEQKLIAIRVVR